MQLYGDASVNFRFRLRNGDKRPATFDSRRRAFEVARRLLADSKASRLNRQFESPARHSAKLLGFRPPNRWGPIAAGVCPSVNLSVSISKSAVARWIGEFNFWVVELPQESKFAERHSPGPQATRL